MLKFGTMEVGRNIRGLLLPSSEKFNHILRNIYFPTRALIQLKMGHVLASTRSRFTPIESLSYRWILAMNTRLSAGLNRITGYDVCMKLKEEVEKADLEYVGIKQLTRTIQQQYQTAVEARLSSQKSINSLLQRKSHWTEEEINQFTDLYKLELKQEAEEKLLKSQASSSTRDLDNAHDRLTTAMRERYQVEQLWSDKIRATSTYGTLILMTVNLVLFLLIQLYLEPKKRQLLIGENQRR